MLNNPHANSYRIWFQLVWISSRSKGAVLPPGEMCESDPLEIHYCLTRIYVHF